MVTFWTYAGESGTTLIDQHNRLIKVIYTMTLHAFHTLQSFRIMLFLQSQPKKNAHFKPRTSGFGKISARTGSGSVSSANTFNHQTKVRPITPDSLLSEDELKLTKEQHPCSQNLGMATAFLMPLAMVSDYNTLTD